MENIPADYWLILCNSSFADSSIHPSAPFGGRFLIDFLFRQI
jgi:hypothetical protein